MIHLQRVIGKETFAIDLKLNEKIFLEAYSVGGTGYQWIPMNFNADIIEVEEQDLHESQIDIIGGQITHCYLISVKRSGEYNIKFKLIRKWLGEKSAIDSFTIHINCKEE